MSPAVRLGLRLALGTPGQRTRSALVVLATAIASWLLISTLAVGHAIDATSSSYSTTENHRLALSIEAAVTLPVLVLAASVARLSASMRDRRLGNLRLLGLAAMDTRVVAATEAGVAAVTGALTGALLYLATRGPLATLSLAGHSWSSTVLHPTAPAWLFVLVGLPVLVAGCAALPVRTRSASALARARRAEVRRPSVWWAVPILAGVAVCVVQVAAGREENPDPGRFTLFFAGCILCGLGVVLVAPWVVRGLADGLLRLAPGPATRIAARRLQSHPGGVVRVVSALMVGLFVVTGARCVLVAFEEDGQYADAAAALHDAQRVVVASSARSASTVAGRARGVAGVRDVVLVPRLDAHGHGTFSGGGAFEQSHAVVLVATCSQLLRLQPELHGCVDGPMKVGEGFPFTGDVTIRHRGDAIAVFRVPHHRLTNPRSGRWPGALAPLEAAFVVPPDTPGIKPLLADAPRIGLVVADGGRDLGSRLSRAGVHVQSEPDFEYYDFVASLRAILWTVAAVVLGVGLLTLALGGIDRALGRRRELASLRILGASPAVLRRAQVLEMVVPTVAGCLLAVATGFLAGATYLEMAELGSSVHLPWAAMLGFSATALAASLGLAAVTVPATNVRLSPDVIRQE